MIFLPSYYYFGFDVLPHGFNHICYNAADRYWFLSRWSDDDEIYSGMRKLHDTGLPDPPISPKKTKNRLIRYMKECIRAAKDDETSYPDVREMLAKTKMSDVVPVDSVVIRGFIIDGKRIYRAFGLLDMESDLPLDMIPVNHIRMLDRIDQKTRVMKKDGAELVYSIHDWTTWHRNLNNPRHSGDHRIASTDADISIKADIAAPRWRFSKEDTTEDVKLNRICINYSISMPYIGFRVPGIRRVFLCSDIDGQGKFKNTIVHIQNFVKDKMWMSSIFGDLKPIMHAFIPDEMLSPASWHNSEKIIDYLIESDHLRNPM